MSSIQRKTFALALVAVMLLSVPLTVSICDDDSDAANAVDYTKWYYNQMDEAMKYAYDGLMASTSDSTTVEVDIPNSVTGNLYDDCVNEKSEKLEYAEWQLWYSVRLDSPETYCTKINHVFDYTDMVISNLTIIFTIEDEYTSQKNKAVDDLIASLHFTGDTVVEKITSIHNYVAETLTYNYEEYEEEQKTGITNWEIRSLYRALVGDHDVVCEGFARAFRAICEHNGIPCIMILDWAGTDDKEMHAWNVVLVEGAWYTVDTTWDNNNGNIRDTYLLVGQKTVCDGITVAESHTQKQTTELGLKLPAPLATNKYGSDVATISFETYGGTAIDPITIKAGTVPTIPEPTWSGHKFDGWYLDGDFTKAWNGSAISSDCCLYAKWLTVEEHSASFEISGIYWAIIVVAAILIIGAVVVKRHR